MLGTTLNQYQIIDRLGAGGMGEVFRARDTRLDRDVAIKVLPKDFVSDPDRRRRFDREARTLAALNHPNVLTIHDAGVHDEVPYLVSELLEGDTLRDELTRHRSGLSLQKAITYAVQIAQGLAAAHRSGAIHRDLKPENIFITRDGRVKVLDFGLAKLRERPGSDSRDTTPEEADTSTVVRSATIPTEPGKILGTPAYMSPEQVRGEPTDQRADVFSFGCVLYEMLGGAAAFRGGSAVEVMHAIAMVDAATIPDPGRPLPAALDRVVRHCLNQHPADRFQSMSDLAFALDALSSDSRPVSTARGQVPAARRRRELVGWIVAATAMLAAAGVLLYRRAPAEGATVRLSIPAPREVTDVRDPALSPDGNQLVFVAEAEGKTMLWARALNSLAAQPLPGTEGASFPFWSPTGQFIGFFSTGKLKKIALAGGPATPLADAPSGVGGTWGRDGTILFTPGLTEGVYRVADAGGVAEPVTVPDASRSENAHWWPSFLPDGRHFLHLAFGSQAEEIGIYVTSLDTRKSVRIVSADSKAIYATAGFLVYVRGATLLAHPFDATERRVTGEPIRLVAPLPYNIFSSRGVFSVSDNGVLVYEARGSGGNELLTWFDRNGAALRTVGSRGTDLRLALSPDETRVAVSRLDPVTRNSDLWLLDLRRGTESRFTYDPATDHDPVWSPDGNRIAWNSNRDGPANLYRKAASGEGQDDLFVKADHWKWVSDWSRDGRFMIYGVNNPQSKADLWVLPLGGDGKPFPWRATPFEERGGRFSPDSKWIAYSSDESGDPEVYVEAFPEGGKWRVSITGGRMPQWRRDGRELFYVAADETVMAVDVTTGRAFEAGVPRPLFNLRSSSAVARGVNGLVVSADGQQFLLPASRENASVEPLTVVLNWAKELAP